MLGSGIEVSISGCGFCRAVPCRGDEVVDVGVKAQTCIVDYVEDDGYTAVEGA